MRKEPVFSAGSECGAAQEIVYEKTDFGKCGGFGVALTGASCYMLSKMEKGARKEFLKSIYSKEGLNLSVARLAIGSCDYSAEIYTYDDVPGDISLEHFSVERDRRYIIPMIKEILEIRVEIPDEIHGFRYKFFHCDKGRKAGGGAHRRIGIVTEGKMIEIFLFQNVPDVGLGVEKIDDGLAETVAFLLTDIASVLAVRAVVMHFKIIRRITVGGKLCFFLTESLDILPEVGEGCLIAFEGFSRGRDAKRSDLMIDGGKLRESLCGSEDAFLLLMAVFCLFAVIFPHNLIVLGIFQRHGCLLFLSVV